MRTSILLSLAAIPLSVAVACTASNPSELDDDDGGGGTTASGGGDNTGGAFTTQGAGGSTEGDCHIDDTSVDHDGDGFSVDDGDCNDCDPNVNPDAVEVIGEAMDGGGGMGGYVPADENCNDMVDEPPTVCDQSLGLNDTTAIHGAKAIDICEEAGEGQSWGVVNANYVRANGDAAPNPDLAVGLLEAFGDNIVPQNGARMLGLSSGHARPMGHPEECGTTSCSVQGGGTAPPDFPQDVPGCSGGSTINDDIALELELQAPSNAKGYKFDFAFMSFEFPEWVCTSYNDQFIALVSPPPMGSVNGNISFDSQSNPVSVNVALFDHCDPDGVGEYASLCFSGCPSPPNPYCPLGQTFMDGTGFNTWDDSGSTGWLVTSAPVSPNETFTIRFAIWDTSDTALDSTVLVDNFTWTADAGTSVGTDPIPDPK